MPSPREILEQIKKLYQDLSIRQKIITAAVLALVITGFGLLFFFTNQTVYRTLYTDLTPADASEIAGWLKAEDIPCRITQEGSSVQVSEDMVDQCRLALAGAGLPKGSGIGFEIFDQTNLGVTDFVQHVNYQRALQGELERTIAQFPQIKSARVHLAQPKESLFVSERREPTASVILNLKRDEELAQNQIKGIAHLVKSAVPRLKKENISIVDTSGYILYEHKENNTDFAKLTNAQLIYQRRLEDYYRHKIQTMLEEALGPNKAVARVSAEVDFDRVQTDEDSFDPDMVAVRSEQKLFETTTEQENGGVPGVKGGLADKLQGNTEQQQSGLVKQKQEDITNYEITRVQRRVNGAIGKLKRMSVGVIIDGSYKQEGEESVYVPRQPEEMASIEQIVKAAMGFSEDRGDEISVMNISFSTEPVKAGVMSYLTDMGTRFARPMTNLILGLLFILLVLRPLLKRYVLKPEDEHTVDVDALEEKEKLGLEALPAFEPIPDPKHRLRELASNYPERAAALVKIWLREQSGTEHGRSKV
ncbi:MAG: flagellar M-ring protein FliF [Desulfuromonadales bacterium C00003093]|nr:MAG: flagellar M-ring protein FliF [Desulfuromonadales bacterium C00003093]